MGQLISYYQYILFKALMYFSHQESQTDEEIALFSIKFPITTETSGFF
jgi:hypothetical protein